VAVLLQAMYSCWHDVADWYLITDDDTFVRPGVLQHSLVNLDASIARLYGVPTNSVPFTLQHHLDEHGPSSHCGGSSVLLSRGLVFQFINHIDHCLTSTARTTLAWYWDEVEFLGRCIYELFHLNCTDLPTSAPSVMSSGGEQEAEDKASPLRDSTMMLSTSGAQDLQLLLHNISRGKASSVDLTNLHFATLHPVEAEQMRQFGSHFGQALPGAQLSAMQRNEGQAGEHARAKMGGKLGGVNAADQKEVVEQHEEKHDDMRSASSGMVTRRRSRGSPGEHGEF